MKVNSILFNQFFNKIFDSTDTVALRLIKILLIIIMCILLFVNVYYIFINSFNRALGLPNVNELKSLSMANSSIEIYDRHDKFLLSLQGKEDRQVIPLEKISVFIKQALIASEDKSFYNHRGINLYNIGRAIFINLINGEIQQGASTLTQQLVKNIYFEPKEWPTIARKIKEMPLALEVERYYSKDEILHFYLNRIYWGKNAYGVERAAQRYFNKHANELNIAESAYLVALLPSPNQYHNTKKAFAIQQNIIQTMFNNGYITQEQAITARQSELIFESAPRNLEKFPYYMTLIQDELNERYSSELLTRGLKVYTNIDPEVQTIAESMLNEHIKNAPQGIDQGALVTIDVKSGQVRSIVGGVGNFWENQWNRATSKHTLGSSFKPIVYLTAIMRGVITSNTKVWDTPFIHVTPDTQQVWKPNNFDKKFWGSITALKALTYSRNIPAIKIADKTGMLAIRDTAKRLGLDDISPYLSNALGSAAASPLAMANAYATLARNGVELQPTFIRKVTNLNNEIIDTTQSLPNKLFPEYPIHELLAMMENVVRQGTGRAASIPSRHIAGKTGTADGSKDIWFVGFTPDTVTILWAGNDENKEASRYATGGGVLAGLWKKYMLKYYEINPEESLTFPKPQPHVKILIDPITRLKAVQGSFMPEWKYFVPGTEPQRYSKPSTVQDIRNYLQQEEDKYNLIHNKIHSKTNPYQNTAQSPNNTETKKVIKQSTANNIKPLDIFSLQEQKKNRQKVQIQQQQKTISEPAPIRPQGYKQPVSNNTSPKPTANTTIYKTFPN